MNRIVIGVPGPWEGHAELIAALARAHGGDYLFAGRIFLEVKTGKSCELHLYEHHDGMRESFEIAGQGQLSEAALDAVAGHRSTAYLVVGEPSPDAARTAARFAKVLLEAGGVAVKVETAGVAHTRERWLERWDTENPLELYTLFVTLVGGDERFFSCGMHNFALPDAAVLASLGPDAGAYLLNVFNVFQLAESPTLHDGETFSAEPGGPAFRLTREEYEEGYDPDEPLYNPHGLWSLRRA